MQIGGQHDDGEGQNVGRVSAGVQLRTAQTIMHDGSTMLLHENCHHAVLNTKKVICLKTYKQFCTHSRESLKVDVHKACAKQIQAHVNKRLAG